MKNALSFPRIKSLDEYYTVLEVYGLHHAVSRTYDPVCLT